MSITNWKDLYLELSGKLRSGVPELNWIDLWANQVNALADEHPFPTPAAFIEFRILEADDEGNLAQQLHTQVDVYLFYETFADTFDGAGNQTQALAYLDMLTAIHRTLHGTSGQTYSEMRRVGMAPVDTGTAGNLYRMSFVCLVTDLSASPELPSAVPGEINISEGEEPPANPEPPLFQIQ